MSDVEKVRKVIASSDRQKLLDRAYEAGFRYERDYHGCAQAMVGALQEILRIENPDVFRAASGLGGGIGLSCLSACGGLSGGIMVISQLYGRTREAIEDKEGKRMIAYKLASRLVEKYVEQYGTPSCQGIQKQVFGRSFDLRKPEDFKALVDAGGHSHVCPEVVGAAAKMTMEVILDHEAGKS
jgi:C_GCAxxG_C_C family probable redox protein